MKSFKVNTTAVIFLENNAVPIFSLYNGLKLQMPKSNNFHVFCFFLQNSTDV